MSQIFSSILFYLFILKMKSIDGTISQAKSTTKNIFQIIRFILRQSNHYKIGNFITSVRIALVTIATRCQFWYIIRYNDKKKR